MSDDVEEITKTPIREQGSVKESVKKEKDPKKVAAGKKLAEYNKRAKEALKEKMKREAEKAPEEERETGESWIPEVSFTTVVSIVSIGLTALNMFISHRKGTKVPSEPPKVRLPEPEPSKPSKIPLPTHRIGMS